LIILLAQTLTIQKAGTDPEVPIHNRREGKAIVLIFQPVILHYHLLIFAGKSTELFCLSNSRRSLQCTEVR
jgi:hypothetical protein